uniref:cytochrome c oxidase assembly factor 5 n=1 Tax=Myxine glutinosa TaxID=7769 RepID=UPI00358F5164
MPLFYEGKEVDPRPCAGLREDLKDCLLKSPCVMEKKMAPKDCLKNDLEMDAHCKALQVSFFECKRSLLDNRTRFRGRKGY